MNEEERIPAAKSACDKLYNAIHVLAQASSIKAPRSLKVVQTPLRFEQARLTVS
jgi:hypothetical protein